MKTNDEIMKELREEMDSNLDLVFMMSDIKLELDDIKAELEKIRENYRKDLSK